MKPAEGMGTMKLLRSWQSRGLVGLGLLLTGSLLVGLTGCQTWVPAAGLTLPSGRYLEHPPQYFPPSPSFPLQHELESMQAAAAAPPPAIPAEPLPPPVP